MFSQADYNSHNTDRLDVDAMKALLRKLFYSSFERGDIYHQRSVCACTCNWSRWFVGKNYQLIASNGWL